MPEIPYHKAHEPCIKAVAIALDAAGIGVGSWFADANDPRDGCIVLSEHDEDDDELCAAWDEEKGWFYGIGPESGEIQIIWWICDDVLPEPADVVADIQRCVAGDYSQATLDHGYYRDFEDEDDGFEELLRAYAGSSDA
ncbi:DUF6292 family protein [Nonomuraea lactucae]|uniref:DUF6292 family protein n=1 Tax=Nonomuraea lactucae TaxID=2249762 RepID=UPI000DE51C43|nr:DUF6292 family protein [Nonomuraea lactucae]